jgi:hypothetical protein
MSEPTLLHASSDQPSHGDSPPASPVDTILTIAGSYCVPRALHVVAELGIADALDENSLKVDELAAATGTNVDALYRVLRLLSAHGVFIAADGTVSHNDASRLLRSDHPQSLRAFVRLFGLPAFWDTYREMHHSLRTGRPSAELLFKDGMWGHLADDAEASRIFNEAMIGKSHGQVAGVLAAYDFAGLGTIADVGGGQGQLIRAILTAYPEARGVLFDLPHVIAEVEQVANGRLDLQPGDFFVDALPTADAYLLMEVIHDWDDDESVRILTAVRRAAPDGARLLLIEQLIGENDGPSWPKMLDIHMLTLITGRQRSKEQYEALAVRAGFQPNRVIDTFGGATILEYSAR